MALKDYKLMQERCSNCSYCKWMPFDKVKSSRFSENCPSVCFNNYNTYSARGRFQFGLAVVNDELTYTEKSSQIVRDCLSCGSCDITCKICRYNLEPLEHNIALKADAVEKGFCSPVQEKLMSSLESEKTMLVGNKSINRAVWAKGLNIKDASKGAAEVLLFPGCRYSYMDTSNNPARFAAKLLLDLGIDLGHLGEADACCAGRAWQMGFLEKFNQRADTNIHNIKKSGARLVVTPCADCYHALKRLYPAIGLDVEVLHITEYLDRLILEGKITFKKALNINVTYHDPCHLGRLGEPYVPWDGGEKKILNQVHIWEPKRPRYNGAYGIYDAPRRILQAIPGVNLIEMERIREGSWCCGAGGGCSQINPEFSAWTAKERITEAKATGADALITACPWCNANFNYAADKSENIQVMDILELVAEAIKEV